MKMFFREKVSRNNFQREELLALKFMKMPVGSFAYKTNCILRLLGAGNQKNQYFRHFRILLKKVTF